MGPLKTYEEVNERITLIPVTNIRQTYEVTTGYKKAERKERVNKEREEQRHFSRKAVATWCLVLILLVQQVTSSPIPELGSSSDSLKAAQRSLRRSARMTPLWRIMGTKPQGAYCQNNLECSTSSCRDGHCTFRHPIQS
ncbi:hypothetical protein AOLI_G00109350 [Acnodon oligacanthus]